jgi:hypothetical protein|tara:strand:+ start:336 stop:674 length:339 start_codon:yes stop_codon:yes gene_type:complete
MARLTTYTNDDNISDNDKLLGTDTSGETRNFKMIDVASYVKSKDHFTHNQTNASTTWTIAHNLNKFPSVSIKFSSSDNVYTNVGALGGVTYTDANNLTITLAAAESGYAYLN